MARKKKGGSSPKDYLQRAGTHVIDGKARKHFTYCVPAEWVVNGLNEVDYGKDYHVELARSGGPIGKAFYVQLKGTEHCGYIENGTTVSFPLEKKYLLHYMGEVKLPVFLVVVDVAQSRGYWLFVQKYLTQNPGWDKAGSYSLRIPITNRLEDAPSLAAAVAEAHEWMKLYQQPPLQERIQSRLRELQAKDSRFKIEATYKDDEERLRFIPVEPVRLKFELRPKNNKITAKMKACLDKGQPVAFDVGELVIEGSTLFSDVVASSGTLQIAAQCPCAANLTVQGESDRPVWSWPGVPAELTGGFKERCIYSRLPGAPFSFEVGPIGGDQKCSTKLSCNPPAWDGQPLLSLSYFDRIETLLSTLLVHPTLGTECESNGNRFFAGRVKLKPDSGLAQLVEYLRLLRKAREVARQVGINPTYHAGPLSAEAQSDIEIAHVILANGRYELRSDAVIDATLWKAEAKQFVDQLTVNEPIRFYVDADHRFQIMGQDIALGRLVWEFPEATLATPLDEAKRRLSQSGQSVPLSFRVAPTAGGTLRPVRDEEWQEARKLFPP
jgi:hypothetical protein